MPVVDPQASAVVQVYRLPLDAHSTTALPEDVLSPVELARYTRWLSPTRRQEFLTGRLLLQHAFSQAGLPFSPLSVDDAGRPGCQLPGVDVSVSHSNGHVVVGLAQRVKLGVDVEVHAHRDTNLMQRFFHDGELAWVAGDNARLHTLWTLKEAAMKAQGTGLSGNPARLHFDAATGILRDSTAPDTTMTVWWDSTPGVSWAVVALGSASIQVHTLSALPLPTRPQQDAPAKHRMTA